MMYQLAPGHEDFLSSRFFLSLQKFATGDPRLLAKAGRDNAFNLHQDPFTCEFLQAIEHYAQEGASTPRKLINSLFMGWGP